MIAATVRGTLTLLPNKGGESTARRRMGTQRAVLAVVVGVLCCWTVSACRSEAGNWPQFRGPRGQGHAAVTGAPIRWSESENVTWKVEVPGAGHSSPVVLHDQIWLTTAQKDGRSLRALCFELRSGRLLHDVEVFAPSEPVAKHVKNSFATPTPVIERGRVYVHFGTMGTACLATDSGQVIWMTRPFDIDHETGPAASPILVGNLFIVNCDGMNEQFVVAIHKDDGAVAWKTERSAPFREDPALRRAFSVPVVVDDRGESQIISVGADQTHAYDPLNGHEIWHVTYEGSSNIPYPLYRDGVVYVVTGFRSPELWAIRVDGHGDVTATHVEWRYRKSVPTLPSPIMVEDRIFMVSDLGVCSSVHAGSGELLWRKRFNGKFSASPVYAGGHIFLPEEDGTISVIEPGATPKIVAVNMISGRIMATPAIVDGAILIRTDQHLYRIDRSK